MAADATRSGSGGSAADSYIGSLISLTSKYEIRYEGVLYNINTEESSIGLRNVRSFGTEGRKKDGSQVPPSDKIYEYILFRGSDIKDLQVKSSPPVQTTPPIDHDPAIIQAHNIHTPAISTSFPPVVSGPVTDLSFQTSGMGPIGGSSFQGGMPLHQLGGSLRPWGSSSLPPNVSGGGPPPMYWQGFYAPQLHQQSLLRPTPGLSKPPSMQQVMQYPSMNSSLLPGSSNLPVSSLPESGPPLLQPGSTHSLNLTSTTLSSTLPSTVSAAQSAALVSETSPNLIPIKAPTSGFSTATIRTSLPFVSPLTNNIFDMNAVGALTSDKPKSVPGFPLPDQTMSQFMTTNAGTSSSNCVETSAPSLVTPSQLLQSAPASLSSSLSLELAHKDVKVVQASSPEQPRAPAETRPPILPLPLPSPSASPPEQKLNAAQYHSYHNHPSHQSHNYRGHGRGRRNGILGAPTTFTEDFDFTAMNEKFNKDEVWGHLGKKSLSKDKEVDNNEDNEDYLQDEDDTEAAKTEVKPVYVKDDFFDYLSSNALDQERRNGTAKFPEQMKIDTETFRNFPRHHGGWGGRGPPRGGRSRGYYHGRGNGGYVGGRGRGQTMSGRG